MSDTKSATLSRQAAKPAPSASDIERSSQLLREALPMISRHGRGFTPISYAVWYEYVRNENPVLRNEIDQALLLEERLSPQVTFDVYQKHVSAAFEKTVLASRSDLLGILEQVDRSVCDAGASTESFGTRLTDFSATIDSPISTPQMQETVQLQIAELRQDLGSVTRSMVDINQQIESSRSEVQRLSDELAKARSEAQMDPLTGLLNRRSFDHALTTQMGAARASPADDGRTLILVMVDIDHFKAVNDEHGHVFGDKVIQGIARLLGDGVMRKDYVARYGGEEFALILPQTDAAGGRAVAERLRDAVSRCRIRRANSDTVLSNITVSLGVAAYRDGETPEAFLERADKALYQAKQQGRNRTCMAE